MSEPVAGSVGTRMAGQTKPGVNGLILGALATGEKGEGANWRMSGNLVKDPAG